jgi:hypothetical protein
VEEFSFIKTYNWRMMLMKKSILMSMITVLILSFGASANAESTKENTIVLRPSEGSYVLNSVELVKDPKDANTVSVRIGHSAKTGVKTGIDVVVDQRTNTYTATLELQEEYEENQSAARLLSTNYTAHVRLWTRDPVNIDCNYTDLGFTWVDDLLGNGYDSITHSGSRSLTYWDANPTSALTNWYYVSSRFYNPPIHNTESAEATHVNYNFLGGAFGTTYAHHDLSIYPQANNPGWYNYYTTLSTSGTGAAQYLLHKYVETY